MEADEKTTREIRTEVAELERRGDLDNYSTPAVDLGSAALGHLLAESMSLSDAEVDRAWARTGSNGAVAAETAQDEVQRVLETVAKSGPTPEPRDRGSDD